MPREIYLATPVAVTLEALVRAGAEVDDQLAVVALYGGLVIQLLEQSDVAVLTVESSRWLADPVDATRIAPALELSGRAVWWTEATTPWGAAGLVGVEIAGRLADRLGGRVRVEDGRA